MKSYIKVVAGALLIGAVLAFVFYRSVEEEVQAFSSDAVTLYLFQVGVFKSYENATNFAGKFESKIVVVDNEYYRVFVGLTSQSNNKNKLMSYYDSKGINYYIKEYLIDKDFFAMLEEYEVVLENTSSSDAIDKLNQEMLDLFEEYGI